MVKILANDGIHPDGQKLLEAEGFIVDTNFVPQDELPETLPSYDAIIVRSATKVRADLIDQCPNLKVIARGGVGLDNIDVEYAENRGIRVFNTPAASSVSVAELALAHIFSLNRFLHRSNRELPTRGESDFKSLKKAYSAGSELSGKTIGIIGLGRIGQELARMALALRMNVMAVDHMVHQTKIDIDLYATDDIGLSVKLNSVSMDTMLANADFISVHIPFSGGRPIIGSEEMAKMKPGAIIINTSRGGVVDEIALLEALDTGHLAGAGLDVFVGEPQPNVRLLNHDKISVSPHIGASTKEAQRKIGVELAMKMIHFFSED